MTLFRAFAYQLQRLNTRPADEQPEVMVFFEAPSAEAAPAVLLRLLALAWGCTPADVEFYNLFDEHELRLRDGDDVPGDAALWCSGMYHGPLFHRLDRTLLLVRPRTLERLLLARQATLPLRDQQREAAAAADQALQAQQRQRSLRMADLAQELRREHCAGA